MGVKYPPNNFTTGQGRMSTFLGSEKPVHSSLVSAQSLQMMTNHLFSKMPTSFNILEFVLKILKILGQRPFTYERNGVNGAYSFSWSSFHITQSLVAAVIASLIWFIFLTHHGLKQFVIFGPGYVFIITCLVIPDGRFHAGLNLSPSVLQDTPFVYINRGAYSEGQIAQRRQGSGESWNVQTTDIILSYSSVSRHHIWLDQPIQVCGSNEQLENVAQAIGQVKSSSL